MHSSSLEMFSRIIAYEGSEERYYRENNIPGRSFNCVPPRYIVLSRCSHYLPGALNLSFMQLDCGDHRISMMFSKTHLGLFQIKGAVNQRDMRKGLRVVSQGDSMLRFDFFRKQAQSTGTT